MGDSEIFECEEETEPELKNEAGPAKGLNEVEGKKATAIEKRKKIRRFFLNCILLIPISSSIFVIALGFWLIAMFVYIKFRCDMEMMTMNMKHNGMRMNTTGMDNYSHNHNSTEIPCPNFRLTGHYPTPSVELLSAVMIAGGVTRCIYTARLYRQVQTSLEEKQIGRWVLHTLPIILVTLILTGVVYKPLQHKNDPEMADHLSNKDNELGMYNLCYFLFMIFLMCFADMVITLVSAIPMMVLAYNDEMFEMELVDNAEAQAKRLYDAFGVL